VKQEKGSSAYGEVVTDFVNQEIDFSNWESINAALLRHVENIRALLGFSEDFYSREKEWLLGREKRLHADAEAFKKKSDKWATEEGRKPNFIGIERFKEQERESRRCSLYDIHNNIRADIEMIADGKKLLDVFTRQRANTGCGARIVLPYAMPYVTLDIGEDDSIREEMPFSEKDHFTDTVEFTLQYCLIKFLKENNRNQIRKCDNEKCRKFFIASKLDSRIKKCPECSRKSTLSREERRLYQQKWRAKKKEEKKNREQEARIKRYMKAGGLTRSEAIDIIKADLSM